MAFDIQKLIRQDSNLGGKHQIWFYVEDAVSATQDTNFTTAGFIPATAGVKPGDVVYSWIIVRASATDNSVTSVSYKGYGAKWAKATNVLTLSTL